MGRSIRLVKIAGIPIEINVSWIFIFLLITYLLAEQFGRFHPGWPLYGQWGLALGVAAAFFLSVLAHELSHSLVALRNGIPVRSITLFFFGGVSHLSHEARRPFTEFVVTVVGPLSSILMALLFGGSLLLLVDGTTSLETALVALFTVRVHASPLEVTLRLLFIINLMLDCSTCCRVSLWTEDVFCGPFYGEYPAAIGGRPNWRRGEVKRLAA